MDTNYMMACGMVWRRTADPDAGWELVEALGSPDPSMRRVARHMLVQRRDNAFELLEDALAAGVLTPEVAGACMVELFRDSGCDAPLISLPNEA